MALFAKLDNDNAVIGVVVVNDSEAPNEAAGIAFLSGITGHNKWRQCSNTGSIRRRYPGPGCTYHPGRDVFVAPKPFPSWHLDQNHDWKAPKNKPHDGKQYRWDEDLKDWVEIIRP